MEVRLLYKGALLRNICVTIRLDAPAVFRGTIYKHVTAVFAQSRCSQNLLAGSADVVPHSRECLAYYIAILV